MSIVGVAAVVFLSFWAGYFTACLMFAAKAADEKAEQIAKKE